MILLDALATEKAEQLDGDPFERIGGGVTLFGVENRGTYVAPKDVGVLDMSGLYGYMRSLQRVIAVEIDRQMDRAASIRRQNEARVSEFLIRDEGNVGVRSGLQLGNIA